MRRVSCIASVVVCISVLSCLPVGALDAPRDAGFVIGAEAIVSKNSIFVSQFGIDMRCPNGTGGPIGVPLLHGAKKAYYDFQLTSTSIAASVFGGPIVRLRVCGQLDSAVGIGAACGMSAGRNGDGGMDVQDGPEAPDYRFNDLGWEATAASVIVVTGGVRQVDGGSSKDQKSGFLGVVSARGVAGQCLNKQTVGKADGMQFTVDVVFVFDPDITVVKRSK